MTFEPGFPLNPILKFIDFEVRSHRFEVFTR